MMVANWLQFILSFLLCVATINAILSPTYKYCCPTAGECASLNVSKFHLYDEVSRSYCIRSTAQIFNDIVIHIAAIFTP